MLKICLDHFRVGACNVRRESRFRCRKQTCTCEKQIKHRTWNTAVGLFLALWVICMGMIRIHQLYLVYYSCCAPGACAFVLFCFQLIHCAWTCNWCDQVFTWEHQQELAMYEPAIGWCDQVFTWEHQQELAMECWRSMVQRKDDDADNNDLMVANS